MEESDHTTRMGTLRRELEQEKDQRRSLEAKVAELQQLLEEVQAMRAIRLASVVDLFDTRTLGDEGLRGRR